MMDRTDTNDPLLDLLGRWDERYRRGDDVTPEALGVTDPGLLDALRASIGNLKRLYARLDLAKTPVPETMASSEFLPEFPGHEVIAETGRGGMGVVYKARDRNLGRIVAIKTMAEGRHATPDQRERFQAEAHAIARLRHSNIIAIHAIGDHDHRPYLSLEFAEGGSLAHRLAEKPMAPREAAELIETLARAVHAAHQAGVVHRDLKPSNILLTADGVPKVSDFGLAKLLDSGSGGTVTGQVMGSPSYMAPEQAEGHSKEVGPAADIYALGAILYQALTGRPPFLGESKLETLKLVTTAEVVPPRRLRPDVPRDLETICLKCLEKGSLKRYASAEALAEDLRRFLDNRPIVARPVGPAGRFGRWCRRNPGVAGLSAAVFVSLVLGTVISTTMAVRAIRAEAATSTQLGRAERARDQAVSAINAIILTDRDPMLSEELRSYREMLDDEGLRLSNAMLQEPEDDPRGQRLHAEALMMKAKLLAEKGERVQAYEYGKRAVGLLEELLARNRADTQNRDAVAQFLHLLGTLTIDRETARSNTLRSNEIYKSLLRDNPQSEQKTEWAGHIALNLHNIGHAFFEEGQSTVGQSRVDQLTNAIEAFGEGEHFCEEQLKGEDQPDRFLFPLAYNERYLCRAYRSLASQIKDPVERTANVKKAIEYGLKAISHFQILAERNPVHYQHSWELHIAQRELGELFIDTGQGNAPAAAIPYYEKARETLKTMASKHGKLVSRMADIQEALAVVDYNMSMAYDNSDPVRYFSGPRRVVLTEIYHICDKLSLFKPLSRNLRRAYAHSCLDMVNYQEEDGERPRLDVLVTGEQLWAEILREDPKNNEARAMLVSAQRGLADELDARGRSDEATPWRSRSLATTQGNPELRYLIATLYAFNSKLVGKWPTKLSPVQLENRRRGYEKEAVTMLREAVADGFKDLNRLLRQPEFASLHSDPAFRAIVLDLQFPADPFARL